MAIEQAFSRLLRVADIRWPDWQTEAQAAQALRRGLSCLLHGKPQDRAATLAFHAHVLRSRPLSQRGREQARQLVARALRRLYAFPEVRRTLARAEIVGERSRVRPASGWIRLDEAVSLTGYSLGGVRAILRRHSEIRRVEWRGRIYVRKKDLRAFVRRQVRRGFGPRKHPRR